MKIASINSCRTDNLAGIRQLVDNDMDLYLIQETCLSEQTIEQRLPGYTVKVSRGEGMLGMATAIKSTIVHKIEPIVPGRLQKIKLSNMTILNVYLPAGTNMAQARRELIQTHLLNEVKQTQMAIIGDFNCVIHEKDVEANFRNKRSIELRQLVETFNLTDIFNTIHPGKIEYTFMRPGSSSARLDRCYLTQDITATSCTHKPVLSDHHALIIDLGMPGPKAKRRQNTWKLNNQVLEDENLLTALANLAQNETRNSKNEDLPEIWEKRLLPTMINMIQEHSKLLHQFKQGTKQMLQYALETAIQNQDWETIEYTKHRLRTITNKELYGLIIRSKESELDEKSIGNIYHARKEMKRAKQMELNTMTINGQECNNIETIENELKHYYTALYNGHHRTEPNSDKITNTGSDFTPDWQAADYFLQDLPKLDPETAAKIDHPITEEEVRDAINKSKANSSPGPDGLTYQFYKKTKEWMIPLLTKIFNTHTQNETLPDRYCKATTRLIPKIEGTPTVEQLRPITLQCCEYKLLSKIIAKRLLKNMNSIIGPWQQCSIPGRNITTPLLELTSTIEQANLKDQEAYVLSTDIFKAYDRANLDYIKEVMRRMGFTEQTIKLINTIHNNCKTTILVGNGVEINITGLRQGDPASGPLYILKIEPLNRALNKEITGVQVGPTTQKIGAFMDDINATSTDLDDINKIDQIFRRYEALSGTILSRSKKTKIMGIGKWRNRSDWPITWLKSTDKLKILGLTFTPDTQETTKVTWTDITRNIRATTQKWIGDRNKTMKEKTTIIHTFILSQVWYASQILPCPQTTINEIERTISHYLFHDQIERISLDQLYKPTTEGGLGLTNTSSKCQALLARTSQRALNNDSKHLKYWVAIPLRLPITGPRAEISTPYFSTIIELLKELPPQLKANPKTKDIYKDFNNTQPPSRIEEKSTDVTTVCQRITLPKDPQLTNHQFKIQSGILPTKSRLHYLNPQKWPDPNCPRCQTPSDLEHITSKCIHQDSWQWLTSTLHTLNPDIQWTTEDILRLTYPQTKHEKETAYLIMTSIKHIWEFNKQHRHLTPNRLKSIIKQNIQTRSNMRLPQLSTDLWNAL